MKNCVPAEVGNPGGLRELEGEGGDGAFVWLAQYLESGESWLIRRVLHYALESGFSAYTAPVEEAWVASVRGITSPLARHLRAGCTVGPIRMDEAGDEDPGTVFGRQEARQHRMRGVPLGMFLAFYKYYRRAYLELLRVEEQGVLSPERLAAGEEILGWYFDRIEVAFCAEWAGLEETDMVRGLQESNRQLANDKNRLLVVFDSLPEPVFFVTPEGRVERANEAALALFPSLPRRHFSQGMAQEEVLLPVFLEEFLEFSRSEKREESFEKKIPQLPGQPYYRVLQHKLISATGQFSGATVALVDTSELHFKIAELRLAGHDLEYARNSSREALAFLHSLIEALPIPLFYKDSSNRFLLVNHKFCEFWGHPWEHFIGATVEEAYPPDLASFMARADEELRALGEGHQQYERTLRFADGRKVDVEMFRTLLPDAITGSEGAGIIGTYFDVTARNADTQALQKRIELDAVLSHFISSLLAGMKTERGFSHALRVFGLGLGVQRVCLLKNSADEDGALRMKMVDQWCEEEFLPYAGELSEVGLRYQDREAGLLETLESGETFLWKMEDPDAPPPVRDQFTEGVTAFLALPIFTETEQGRHFWGSLFLICCGWELDWDNNVMEVSTASAQLLGAFLTRKEEVELLAILDAAVNSAQEGFLITEAGPLPSFPRILFANPALERLTGYSLSALLGKSPLKLLGHGSAEAILHQLANPHLEDQPVSCETLVYRQGGGSFLADWTISPVRDPDGHITHHISIQRDITEEKALQNRVAITSKLESVGSLAAGIAHEINSPSQFIGDNLVFVLGALEKVRQEIREAEVPLSARVREDLETEVPLALSQALEGVERVARIVSSMREFAHPDNDFSSVDLNRCVESSCTVCRNEWKHVAELVLELDPDLPRVPGIRGDLNQVVVNLVVNAAQAIASQKRGSLGKITLRTERIFPAAEEVRVSVRDDGPGIPLQIQEKIFDPFFTTKPVGQGTGQGLFLAYQTVVRKHDGRLYCHSSPGEGTVFVIELPLHRSSPTAN